MYAATHCLRYLILAAATLLIAACDQPAEETTEAETAVESQVEAEADAAPEPVVIRELSDDPNVLALAIYKELIETNTTHSVGDTTDAAERMAAWLRLAGFEEEDIFIGGPVPKRGNLVARFGGTGELEPIILLAHLDVVEANPDDWSMDPFTLLEQDGYYYGRGTIDDKAMSAIWVANFIRYKQEGFMPNRDLILALTADEEGGANNGVIWLLAEHPELVTGAFTLNEGGGGMIRDGKYIANGVQAGEKVYQDFTLTVRNPGGHSSRPRKDNAIYSLVQALARIEAYEFPVEISEIMKLNFERMQNIETGEMAEAMRGVLETPIDPEAVRYLSDIPAYNARIRTTAVATMLDAGHAVNALPQTATANVNVRIMPGTSPRSVLDTLIRVVSDPEVDIQMVGEATPSEPSPLTDEVLGSIEAVTEELWPGVPVVPIMSTGATDGLFFRNAGIPTYGVSGIFGDINDARAHGQDERILVQSFYEGEEFLYRLVKRLSTTSAESE